MKLNIYPLLIIAIAFSCKDTAPKQVLIPEAIDWYLKDVELDTVPGIGLERAYAELIDETKGEEIVVAVIDYQIDLAHEDLVDQIYTNPKEIPANDIDDDTNGFVDDVHGWNFIGIGDYESLKHGLDEYARIVKRLQHKYKDKVREDITAENMGEYLKYIKAVEQRNKNIIDADELIQMSKNIKEKYLTFKEYFSNIYPQYDNYTLFELDSVIPEDEKAEKILKTIKGYLKYGVDLETTFEEEKKYIIQKYTNNNLNYNDRELIGDDPYDYADADYGNNYVQASPDITHGTLVAGTLAATRDNGKGTRGISNKIRIMALPILTKSGTENDKDFYNAIRYAVDNGARVINFSSSKLVADNESLLFNALKYAEKNNVLVVSSGGNGAVDIDNPDHWVYPMDQDPSGNTVNNLINVGASGQYMDERLYVSFSNYGKENIDLFAPGEDMRTPTAALTKYADDIEGTSISSAVTSGVAALLLSQYPDLTAIQVKDILMESGTEYDVLVNTIEKDSVPFKELSKSGKIINAYKAFKMARQISKGQD